MKIRNVKESDYNVINRILDEDIVRKKGCETIRCVTSPVNKT